MWTVVRAQSEFMASQHNSQFTMLERTDTSITLVLASDERTFQIYPFSFRLLVSYKLEDASL